MSFEFSQFESNREADPTSDFLQRERMAAGELLGDDQALFGSSVSGHVSDDVAQRAQAFPALDDEVPFEDARSTNLGTPDVPQVASSALDDDAARFQASFPALNEDSAPVDEAAWGASLSTPAMDATPAMPAATAAPTERAEPTTEPAPPSSTPFSYGDLNEETEPLRAWQESQAQAIAEREARAERQRAEAISQAEQDIDQFYAEYNAQKEKNIKKNKESEAHFREQMQQELAEGTTWTRITKLLELQNSQSKTIAKGGPGSSDLSRLKELYLHLRREGDKAPGAAGY
ncbi:Clathrin light chain [Malassezia equina]|uniref:Clathrin light chain n=1 Tax=Malassezia equina TaxID=1381935 RepID=A0AAF0ED35_9BASI|nr:Clathrin light chain [Malassezia equina]